MARYDNRTVPDDHHSFYVFDDLRFQQNPLRPHRGSFDIYYYDTLDAALTKFQEIPEDMTPALGMHRSPMSELDLIHRRGGESILVSDYLNFSKWRTDPTVQKSVDTLCSRLNVEWCMDSKCFTGTILVPLERNLHRIPDKGIADKALRPRSPQFLQSTVDPSTAVNEVFSPQMGWIPYNSAAKAAESFGFHDPNLLKVQQFNINYTDLQGRTGQRDVSPMEMQLLMERWKFQHNDRSQASAIARKTADELDDFFFSVNITEHTSGAPDKDKAVSQMAEDILSGNTDYIAQLLRDIRDNGHQSDQNIAQAHIFLSRIEGFHNTTRKPALDHLISAADARVSATAAQPDLTEHIR